MSQSLIQQAFIEYLQGAKHHFRHLRYFNEKKIMNYINSVNILVKKFKFKEVAFLTSETGIANLSYWKKVLNPCEEISMYL
jgi:hypothetical protein